MQYYGNSKVSLPYLFSLQIIPYTPPSRHNRWRLRTNCDDHMRERLRWCGGRARCGREVVVIAIEAGGDYSIAKTKCCGGAACEYDAFVTRIGAGDGLLFTACNCYAIGLKGNKYGCWGGIEEV